MSINNKSFNVFNNKSEWLSFSAECLLKSTFIMIGAGLVGYSLMLISGVDGRPLTYNASFLFIIGTLLVSLNYGLLPGIYAALIGFFGYHFFFQYPKFSFIFDSTNEGVNLTLFMLCALFSAFIGSHSRRQLRALKKRERRITVLHNIYERLVLSEGKDDVVKTLEKGISEILQTEAIIFLPDNNGQIASSFNEIEKLSKQDRDEIVKSWKEEMPFVNGITKKSLMQNSSNIYTLPLVTKRERIGVLALKKGPSNKIDRSEKKLIKLLADQAAVAIERSKLAKNLEEEKNQKEKEELRSALLSSVTHDLKTPLVSIIGSLSAIIRMPDKLNKKDQLKLIQTSHDEAERLNSFISNILSMTKLESGFVKLSPEWVYVGNILDNVIKRMKHRLKNHNIIREGEKIEIMVDIPMMEQVLQNLLDNAVKYSPENSDIIIETTIDATGSIIKVIDEGKGVPIDVREKIFDKFFRISKRDHRIAGTGLGLSICKTIILAHGGEITVSENAIKKGSIFSIKLPGARYKK